MKSNVLHLLNDSEGCSSKNPAPHGVVRNPGKEEQGRNWCHHICRDRLALVSWREAVFACHCLLSSNNECFCCFMVPPCCQQFSWQAAGSGTSFKVLELFLPGVGHLLFVPVSILVCPVLRCSVYRGETVYRRFLLMGNTASSKWHMSLVCESLLTFFFYHFSCNLPPSLIIWVVLLFVFVLSTFLSLYMKLSVPASVIVSSLTRTKAAEPGGFFCLCVCRDFARVFLWTLPLSSSAVLGRKARLWHRLQITNIFAEFYL